MEQTRRGRSARVHEMLEIVRRQGVLRKPTPIKLRRTLEELGPTYVKLGQILSMRPDILPRAYCKELELLRTAVKPMPYDQVIQVIQQEQGEPLTRHFRSVDPEPIGSASIAQVHSAVLQDGSHVVVKVQRPNIREVMEQDVELLRQVLSLLNAVSKTGKVFDLPGVLEEMWRAAQQELDFLTEADHLCRFAEQNQDTVFVSCPRVYDSLTTRHMLVMEYVGGHQIDNITALDEDGYDRTEIGSKLVDNYMKQVLDDGFFHADPHPGNLRIQDGKIIWLDLGMVGELGNGERKTLGAMIEAVAAEDIMALKNNLLNLGIVKGTVNHPQLYDEIDSIMQRYAAQSFGNMDLGVIMEELIDVAARNGIAMPPDITMLGRGIVVLEGVLASICPEINFIQLAANRAKGHAFDWSNISEKLLKTGSVFAHNANRAVGLTGQLSDLLRMTVKGQTRILQELSLQEDTLRRFEKISARLTLAVVDAALWIAGALLYVLAPLPEGMNVPQPGTVVLILAAVLTAFLCIRMLPRRRHTRKPKRK